MGKKENLEAAKKLVQMYEDFLATHPADSFESPRDFVEKLSKITGFGEVKTCSLCNTAGVVKVEYEHGIYQRIPQCHNCIHSVRHGYNPNFDTDVPCTIDSSYAELHSDFRSPEEKMGVLRRRIKYLKSLIVKAEKENWAEEE